MAEFRFETVDVFTDERFGGNPLAVFVDARGLSDAQMQALAAELNLSETTFVLPPSDPANTARVRIFNRTTEMAFAGHPSIGTAYVLARNTALGETLRLEAPAGIVRVDMERDASGLIVGGTLTVPQPLSLGDTVSPETIAACAGLRVNDVITHAHEPVQATTGNPYVIAEVAVDALDRAAPDLNAFRAALAERPHFGNRFSLHLYARDGENIRARMFAPLSGTWEDPATGSANAPLVALLLSLTEAREARFVIRQGEKMGRPSLIRAQALRTDDGISAKIGGDCVPMFRGLIDL
jgi:trans-2,3-dihydro-3-hydroxyanthranilate isomerase